MLAGIGLRRWSPRSKAPATYDAHIPLLCSIRSNRKDKCCYLFENWLALLAFLRPYFFLSFILESLVRNPAALRAGL